MAVVRAYFDQDLRNGIDGLTTILKQRRVAVASMKSADLVLFINRSRTMFKMFSGSGHLVTYKSKKGRLNIEDIKSVSKVFVNTDFKSSKTDKQVAKVLNDGAVVYHDGDHLKAVV